MPTHHLVHQLVGGGGKAILHPSLLVRRSRGKANLVQGALGCQAAEQQHHGSQQSERKREPSLPWQDPEVGPC